MTEAISKAREESERAWRKYQDLCRTQPPRRDDDHALWCHLSEALKQWSAAQAQYYALLQQT